MWFPLEPTDDRIYMSYLFLLILFVECHYSLKTQVEQMNFPMYKLTLSISHSGRDIGLLVGYCRPATDTFEYVYNPYIEFYF